MKSPEGDSYMNPQLRPQDHEVRLRKAEKVLERASVTHSFALCALEKAHESFVRNPVKDSRLVTLLNAAQALRDADVRLTQAIALVEFVKEWKQETEA